jgi:hypothetical protein
MMSGRGLFETDDAPLVITDDRRQPPLDPPPPPAEPVTARAPRTLSERLADAAAERQRQGIRLDANGLPIL